MDIATLGLVVVASGAVAALNSFAQAAGRATAAGNAAAASGTRQTTVLRSMELQARRTGSTMHNTFSSMASTLAHMGLALGTVGLVQYADTWALVGARLELVTRNTEEARAIQQMLWESAQNTGTQFETIATLYTRVARNADVLGKSQNQLVRFTDLVNKSLVTSGATVQEASQGMIQLSQALASGQLRGDEFRSVMEGMPALARAIAHGMGRTTDELYKMREAGQLTNTAIIDAVLQQGAILDEQARRMPMTIGRATTVLRNEVMRLTGAYTQASGAGQFLSRSILWLAENIDKVAAAVVTLTSLWIAYRAALLAAAAAQAAMNLMSRGLLGVAAALAAAGAGILLYTQLLEGFNKATEEWSKNVPGLDDVIGQAKTAGDELTRAARARLRFLADYRSELAELVREAEQEYELAQRMGMAQEEMRLQYDATNRILESRANLQERVISGTISQADANQLMVETEEAVNRALRLRLEALQAARAMEISVQSADRLNEMQNEIELTREIGIEQARLAINLDAINQEYRARRELTGVALAAELQAIELQRQLAQEVLNVTYYANDMAGAFTATFEQIFTDGVHNFRDLFSNIKAMFLRMIAEMAAAAAWKRVGGALTGLLAGMVGGPGAVAAATGEATKVMIAGIDASAAVSWAKAAAPYIGPAAAGFVAGQWAGGMTRNSAGGAALGAAGGAAAGALVGSIVPGVGTAAGALVGGLAGLIGGFMGARKAAEEYRKKMEEIRKSQQALNESIELRTLEAQGRQEEYEMRRLVLQQQTEYNEVAAAGTYTQEQLNELNELYLLQLQQLAEEQERARQQRARELETELQSIEVSKLRAQGLDYEADSLAFAHSQQERLQKALLEWGETNPELIAQLEELLALEREYRAEQRRLAVEAFNADLEVRRLQALGMDDLAEIRRQELQHEQQIAEARRQGYDVSALMGVQNLERAALIAAQNRERLERTIEENLDSVVKAIDAQLRVLKEQLDVAKDQQRELQRSVDQQRRTLESLQEFIDTLTLNENLTTLDPIRMMEEARRQYETTLTAARGGDQQAQQDLQRTAQAYLTTARDVFASSPAYVAIFDQVRAGLLEVSGQMGDRLDIDEQILAVLNAQVERLEQQIAALEAAKAQAKADAQRQLDELKANTAKTADVVAKLEQGRIEAIANANAALTRLDLLRNTVTGTSQAEIDAIRASIAQDVDAVNRSQANLVAAIQAGANQQHVDMLAALAEAQQNRLNANTNTGTLLAELIAGNNLTRDEINTLIQNRASLLNAHDQNIAAINNGASREEIILREQIAKLEQQRFDSNANFYSSIAHLRQIGAIDDATYHKIEQARREADAQYQNQINALYEQIARLRETRDAANNSANASNNAANNIQNQRWILEAIRDTNYSMRSINNDINYWSQRTWQHVEYVRQNLIAQNQNWSGSGKYNIPAFAMGGVHTGGLRLVGEQGPELEVTGPSRILSNNQLMEALRDRGTNRVVEELQQQNRSTNALLRLEQEANLQLIDGIKQLGGAMEDLKKEVKRLRGL